LELVNDEVWTYRFGATLAVAVIGVGTNPFLTTSAYVKEVWTNRFLVVEVEETLAAVVEARFPRCFWRRDSTSRQEPSLTEDMVEEKEVR